MKQDSTATTDVDTLFDTLEALQADRKLPPVDQWHPDRHGRIDIRIARDGTWYHEGTPIRRSALVKLFSTVLRRDPDGFCLVTPAEKLTIEVEDAPFVAVNMEVRGSGAATDLLFTTNVGDHVVASARHPLRVDEDDGEPRPYVLVRPGLEALINRAVFYRLVDLARPDGRELVVHSRGERFSLGKI
ncbi:MAG: DUF1285 domain-containing protein [Roseibium album]|uniref:DUF1285 domain-containing protein n=1 Tax=Roseibium album TaxID=311410 RepID=UPI0032EEDC0A